MTAIIDILALPTLGLLVAGFLIYIAVFWLGDKKNRALRITSETEDDEDDLSDDDYFRGRL